jgi:hypothetical protein
VSFAESLASPDDTPEDKATIAHWGERVEKLGHLYHYKGLRGEGFARLYDVTVRNELFFSSYGKLNDPFDGGVLPTAEGTEQEKRVFWERHVRESIITQAEVDALIALPPDEQRKLMRDRTRREVASFGVACFSEIPDDIPMWAYYADSHSGICLRFRVPSLLGVKDSRLIPLTYLDEYPAFSFYRGSAFRRAQLLVAMKANVWSHEKEWRMVRPAGHGVVQLDPSALDGVILGCRIESADEDRVKDLIERRRPMIELLRAAPADREFKLDIQPA